MSEVSAGVPGFAAVLLAGLGALGVGATDWSGGEAARAGTEPSNRAGGVNVRAPLRRMSMSDERRRVRN